MTDTEKWKRPWFRALSSQYKLLWLYILDNCDNAGVWYVDLELAEFYIGATFDAAQAAFELEKQIVVSGNRWIVRDFVAFQYGDFSEKSAVHKSVLRNLEGYGLSWPSRHPLDTLSTPYRHPIDTPKDKEKAKALAKATAKGKAKAVRAGVPA